MKEVKMTRVDIVKKFKSLIIRLGRIGFIIGIIVGVYGIIAVPVKVTEKINGIVIIAKTYPTSEVVWKSLLMLLSSILYCIIFAIIIAVLITVIALLFNLMCNAIVQSKRSHS